MDRVKKKHAIQHKVSECIRHLKQEHIIMYIITHSLWGIWEVCVIFEGPS